MADRPDSSPDPVSSSGLNESTPPGTSRSGSDLAIVAWEAISAGKRQVLIRFKDQTYQLRETRNGKLILTK